jgi:hypothetical protein
MHAKRRFVLGQVSEDMNFGKFKQQVDSEAVGLGARKMAPHEREGDFSMPMRFAMTIVHCTGYNRL